MDIGDSVSIGVYDVRLERVEKAEHANFIAERARFDVGRNNKVIRTLIAERRFYPVRQMQTTEAAIWTSVKGDLYLVLGERQTDTGWAVKTYYNPLVFWLWFGAGLLAAGGFVAAWPKRALVEKTIQVKSEATVLT